MKRYCRCMFWAALLAVCLGGSYAFSAEDAAALWKKANDAYRQGDYQKAYSAYEAVSESVKAADVYYNMANAAFKQHRLGLAVLNYERARRFDPREPDAIANLKYVNSLIEYRVEDKRNWYYRTLLDWLGYVRLEECVLAVMAVFLLWMVSIVSALAFRRSVIFSRGSWLLLVLVGVFAIPATLKFHQTYVKKRAVVVQPKADVRYAPSSREQLAFRLVEGLGVQVVDRSDGWYRILLANGESGWIPRESVEIV